MSTSTNQIDFAALFARIRNILIEPKKEWPRIANEVPTISQMMPHVGAISLFSTVPQFFKYGFITGSVIASFIGCLVSLYILCRVAEYLAPRFGGRADRQAAFALAAYAMTASWLSNISLVLGPLGSVFALVGIIYSIYSYRLGAPELMKITDNNAAHFTAAVFGTIVLFVGLLVFLLRGCVYHP